jgi:hypothetical protein
VSIGWLALLSAITHSQGGSLMGQAHALVHGLLHGGHAH